MATRWTAAKKVLAGLSQGVARRGNCLGWLKKRSGRLRPRQSSLSQGEPGAAAGDRRKHGLEPVVGEPRADAIGLGAFVEGGERQDVVGDDQAMRADRATGSRCAAEAGALP